MLYTPVCPSQIAIEISFKQIKNQNLINFKKIMIKSLTEEQNPYYQKIIRLITELYVKFELVESLLI